MRPKHAHLLAMLLLADNSPVSSERLVDELWQGRPPTSAPGNLKTYVWALRRQLSTVYGPQPVPLLGVRGGYRLEVADGELDTAVFARLVERARTARREGRDTDAEAALTEALALWRGQAFQDLPDSDGLREARHRLREQLDMAQGDLVDLWLSAGRSAEVIGPLRARISAHPLRERLWGQLMTALSRDGRRVEALDTYRTLRRTLVDELGVEPSAELQALHRRLLNGDPPAPPVVASAQPTPRQLPLDIATFVGREAELTRLAELLADGDGPAPVVVVHGPPGSGKSALAVRAANAVGRRYPDGHLYAHLHGATPGREPAEAAGCLGMFLRALGVAPTAVPPELDEAAALFRTLVAGRRMLIVLDDAASVAQVRPLLPGGVGSAVLITSRIGLATLDGSSGLPLGPLAPEEAESMLDRLLADGRTADEPEATRRLAELCNRLPLGLHVAAARLKARPGWPIQWFVDRLADERDRLAELAVGDVGVRGSLMVSYAALNRGDDPRDRAAASAFCLLGLVQVSDIDTALAAALCGTPDADAETLVERLADAHLLEPAAVGRYRLHDLVRLFAQERSAEETRHDQRRAAIGRVLRYYLATAVRANSLAYPNRLHYPTRHVGAAARTLADRDEARTWLDRERSNLVALGWQALRGPYEEHRALGVNLVKALHWYFIHGCHVADSVGLNEHVLTLAQESGDVETAACAHGSLSFCRQMVGDWDGAAEHNERELALSRSAGDRFGELRALGNLSLIDVHMNRPRRAMARLLRQLDIARRLGAHPAEAFALGAIGRIHWRHQRYADATDHLQQALERYRATGDDYGLCWVLLSLGQIGIELGELSSATAMLHDAIGHARRIGNRLEECWILISLAQASLAAGDRDEALRQATAARTLAAQIGEGEAEAAAIRELSRAVADRPGNPGASPGTRGVPSGRG